MWGWLGKESSTKADIDSPSTEKKQENANGESTIVDTKENLKNVASNVSNYLYSFANVATKTASKLKESVDDKIDKSIVGDFQRENEKFVQDREARRIGDAVPPWTGYHEEESMKKQILALSSDERNFLRDPPSGVDFKFHLDQSMPVAMAALKEDKTLQQMRFDLVPKRIKEERFWRNYFYRVSLIKQSTQLSSLADQELNKSPHSSSSESLNTPRASDKTEIVQTKTEESADDLDEAGSPTTHEFVSDAFQENEGLSEEEKKQMLGGEGVIVEPANSNWEEEIQEELADFELVDGDKKDGDDDWEKEIEDMLELESDSK